MRNKTAVDDGTAADATDGPRKKIYVDEAQVAAAKLQITLDRKLGRKTPEIVKKIAAAK